MRPCGCGASSNRCLKAWEDLKLKWNVPHTVIQHGHVDLLFRSYPSYRPMNLQSACTRRSIRTLAQSSRLSRQKYSISGYNQFICKLQIFQITLSACPIVKYCWSLLLARCTQSISGRDMMDHRVFNTLCKYCRFFQKSMKRDQSFSWKFCLWWDTICKISTDEMPLSSTSAWHYGWPYRLACTKRCPTQAWIT
jgi:hypothetical protein